MTRRARTYHYIAYTRAGALAEGRLQATSLDDAIEILWRARPDAFRDAGACCACFRPLVAA